MLTALNFAKALTCKDVVSSEPCGECPSCKKIDSMTHPDVFILRAEKEGSSIKIDDVRQLIKDIYLKPFEAKKKVYIIDGAEDMKHEAANALLKTLEEPPTDSILILITDNLRGAFSYHYFAFAGGKVLSAKTRRDLRYTGKIPRT